MKLYVIVSHLGGEVSHFPLDLHLQLVRPAQETLLTRKHQGRVGDKLKFIPNNVGNYIAEQ